MPIAKILVPVRSDGKGENILAHAAVATQHVVDRTTMPVVMVH